jgi:hypothetical protein
MKSQELETMRYSQSLRTYFGDHEVLIEFKDVFQKVPGLPPKRDINFSINLILGETPVSKVPYRMSTLEMKELQL